MAELRTPGRIVFVRDEIRDPDADEVVIKVTQVAVCGSDVDRFGGRDTTGLPMRICHEIAGEVVETGRRVTGLQPGAHVVAWTPDGRGFADYFLARADHCVPVREDVAFPAIAEPLGCIVNTVALARPLPGDDVVIVGASGFMGQLLVLLSKLMGASTIIAAGRRPEGLERARALGATHVVNTRSGRLDVAVAELTNGAGADISYECTGVQEGITLAGRVTRPGRVDRRPGKLVIVGYHQGPPRETDWGAWNGAGLEVLNAHFRPYWDCMDGMRRAVRLMEGRKIDSGLFLDHTFPLTHIQEAFRLASARRGEKVAILG